MRSPLCPRASLGDSICIRSIHRHPGEPEKGRLLSKIHSSRVCAVLFFDERGHRSRSSCNGFQFATVAPDSCGVVHLFACPKGAQTPTQLRLRHGFKLGTMPDQRRNSSMVRLGIVPEPTAEQSPNQPGEPSGGEERVVLAGSGRTVSTGVIDSRTTFSATLPMTRRVKPLLP